MSASRLGLIAAVSPQGVIGQDNKIPWHYPADLARFKRLTLGHTVVMGRHTWESLPKRPLPKRRNLVVTSHPIAQVECFPTLEQALEAASGEVWCIGGARLYAAAMLQADLIDLTFVPDEVHGSGLVYFPNIDEAVWQGQGRHPLPEDPALDHEMFLRRVRA